jgi:hypothetical protein
MIFQNFGFNRQAVKATLAPAGDPYLKLWLDAGNSTSYPGTGTTWYDLSSEGNNLTLNGSPTYDATTGSFYFPGSTSVNASTTTATNLSAGTGQQSIEVWNRYTGTVNDNYYGIYALGCCLADGGQIARGLWGDAGFGYGLEASYGNNSLAAFVPPFDGTHTYTKSNSSGVWRQLVVVRDGDTLYYYVDGALDQSRSGFSSFSLTNTNEVLIGRDLTTGPMLGDIAVFKTWIGKALTSTEISASYNASKTRFGR